MDARVFVYNEILFAGLNGWEIIVKHKHGRINKFRKRAASATAVAATVIIYYCQYLLLERHRARGGGGGGGAHAELSAP
jgi:hypothetical protein